MTQHELYFLTVNRRVIGPMPSMSQVGQSGITGTVAERVENVAVTNDKSETAEEKSSVKIRSLFPETWLWDIINIGFVEDFPVSTQIVLNFTPWLCPLLHTCFWICCMNALDVLHACQGHAPCF